MCSAPQVALIPGLPWSWSADLGATVTIAVGVTIAVVLVSRMTSRRDRRRFVALVRQRVGRWLP
jgi:hypothetical protein